MYIRVVLGVPMELGGVVSYSVLLSSPSGWSCRISPVIHFHFHTSRWMAAQYLRIYVLVQILDFFFLDF